MRVGGEDEVKVNVRLIAATNHDLDAAVKQSSLRADLMYRLAVFPIRVPPLREREGDVDLLAQYFLDVFNSKEKTCKKFCSRSMEILRTYSWPGNVRELKNVVHRAHILATDRVVVEDSLPDLSLHKPTLREGTMNFFVGTPLADVQREIILATLKHFDGNKRVTAAALEISLKTLYNRLKEY